MSFPLQCQKSQAEKLVSAICHFYPHKARALPIARRYLAQLRRQHRVRTKPPMVKDVVTAVAWRLVNEGFSATALGVLVQFDCYLRPAELCGLRVRNIVFPRGNVLGGAIHQTLLLLSQAKTGPLQSVDVVDHRIVRALRRLVEGKEDHIKLFPSYSVFCRRFKNALRKIGLGDIGYTPHSLRHGAATTDLINKGGKHLKAILYRGRWVSNAGRSYLQRGAAALLDAKLPRRITRSYPRTDRRLLRFLISTRYVPRV